MNNPLSLLSTATHAKSFAGIFTNDALFNNMPRRRPFIAAYPGVCDNSAEPVKEVYYFHSCYSREDVLIPPEKPITSCGKTGPRMKNSS